jgi:hypothetical protein
MLGVTMLVKSISMRFYEFDYAWKKGNTPKRGKFSPDFFILVGDIMLVIEIKVMKNCGNRLRKTGRKMNMP